MYQKERVEGGREGVTEGKPREGGSREAGVRGDMQLTLLGNFLHVCSSRLKAYMSPLNFIT